MHTTLPVKALHIYTCGHYLLQGYDQDGVDDLVSGVLMGSYHSGGGGGPLLGGAFKHALGFPWSGAVFAAVFAAQGIAIAVLATVMPPEPKYDEGLHEKLAPISGERCTQVSAMADSCKPCLWMDLLWQEAILAGNKGSVSL